MNVAVLKNISSLTVENLVRLAVGLVMSICLARLLGPADFGRYNYIITFVLVFMPFFTFGMDDIIVKELVQNKDAKESIISNANLLRFASSILGLVTIYVCLFLFARDAKDNLLPFSVLALCYVFKSFETYKFVYTAKVAENTLVPGRIIIFLMVATLKLISVFFYQDWVWLVLLTAIEVPGLILFTFIRHQKDYASQLALGFDRELVRKMLNYSFPLFLMQFLFLANGKIDQVMLAKMLDYESLSYYATSAKLIELWVFVPNIISVSLFPDILAATPAERKIKTRTMYGITLWFGLALLIGVWFVKGPLIDLLYGEQYESTKGLITLYAVSFLFQIFNLTRQKYIVVKNKEYLAAAFTSLSLVANVVANYYFIQQFGVKGAIIGTIVSQVISNIVFMLVSNFYRETAVDLCAGVFQAPLTLVRWVRSS